MPVMHAGAAPPTPPLDERFVTPEQTTICARCGDLVAAASTDLRGYCVDCAERTKRTVLAEVLDHLRRVGVQSALIAAVCQIPSSIGAALSDSPVVPFVLWFAGHFAASPLIWALFAIDYLDRTRRVGLSDAVSVLRIQRLGVKLAIAFRHGPMAIAALMGLVAAQKLHGPLAPGYVAGVVGAVGVAQPIADLWRARGRLAAAWAFALAAVPALIVVLAVLALVVLSMVSPEPTSSAVRAVLSVSGALAAIALVPSILTAFVVRIASRDPRRPAS